MRVAGILGTANNARPEGAVVCADCAYDDDGGE